MKYLFATNCAQEHYQKFIEFFTAVLQILLLNKLLYFLVHDVPDCAYLLGFHKVFQYHFIVFYVYLPSEVAMSEVCKIG